MGRVDVGSSRAAHRTGCHPISRAYKGAGDARLAGLAPRRVRPLLGGVEGHRWVGEEVCERLLRAPRLAVALVDGRREVMLERAGAALCRLEQAGEAEVGDAQGGVVGGGRHEYVLIDVAIEGTTSVSRGARLGQTCRGFEPRIAHLRFDVPVHAAVTMQIGEPGEQLVGEAPVLGG